MIKKFSFKYNINACTQQRKKVLLFVVLLIYKQGCSHISTHTFLCSIPHHRQKEFPSYICDEVENT